MTLEVALTLIAAHLSLDPDDLIAYAEDDATLGGFHHDAAQSTFPGGSLYGVEGQALYALVRALRPLHALELGVLHGASTAHLRSAIRANGHGQITSVDVWEGAGSLIPEHLWDAGKLVYDDALKVIPTLPDARVDFCYEDMIHGYDQVRDVVTALKPKLARGAVVVHHDSEHGHDGVEIKRGLADAGVTDYVSVLIDPSDCGILVYRVNR